jgi:hypothetical protein
LASGFVQDKVRTSATEKEFMELSSTMEPMMLLAAIARRREAEKEMETVDDVMQQMQRMSKGGGLQVEAAHLRPCKMHCKSYEKKWSARPVGQ